MDGSADFQRRAGWLWKRPHATGCSRVREALATPGLSLAPLSPEIGLESSRLPSQFHGDPADRILVATARTSGGRLITKDRKLLEYGRERHALILAA